MHAQRACHGAIPARLALASRFTPLHTFFRWGSPRPRLEVAGSELRFPMPRPETQPGKRRHSR
eukprot:7128309-Lingulodinium_polyedra.AAC.1